MNKEKAHIHNLIIVDESGSMSHLGATDKTCGEGVRALTQKPVAKRYMIAKKSVPLHYES